MRGKARTSSLPRLKELMLPSHLRKFTKLYTSYGLGAVKNIWLLVCLLPLGRTVNLNKLKDYVGGVLPQSKASPQSHYKRLIRFFQKWSNDVGLRHSLMQLNAGLLQKLGFKYLILDGTSWQMGQDKIHYLVLSVLVGSVAVPIYWVQLEKLGSSSQDERKVMFEQAFQLFDLKGMTLLADREYIGQQWFKFLKDSGLNFVIRLRWGDYYEQVDGQGGLGYVQMAQSCFRRQKRFKKRVTLQGQQYSLLMIPNPKADADEPILIFLTTLPPTKRTANLYTKRWKIECLFKHLKSNGYHLEDLNLKDPDKHCLMMALVSIAYVLAIQEGAKHLHNIPIQTYQDGSKTLETSIFREGLAQLTAICFSFARFLNHVVKLLKIRSHPWIKNVQ